MIKTVVKWLILTLLLCYTAIVVVWAAERGGSRLCSGVEVEIVGEEAQQFVTRNGVEQMLERVAGDVRTVPVSELNTLKIEQELGKDNSFEGVECFISSDNKLRVRIVPMIPEIRVVDSAGRSYYINKDGKRIDTGGGFFVDVPVVSGDFSKAFPAKYVLPVTRHIASDPKLRNLITMVEAKSAENILLYPCIKGHVINIGDTADLEKKFSNLMLMYHKVMAYKGWETYDTISVKYNNQIVATRRDKRVKAHSVVVADSIDRDEMNMQGIEDITVPQAGAVKSKEQVKTEDKEKKKESQT